MTTTGIYQGLQGEKSTSRVSQPPGGSSNNIFGTDQVQVPVTASRGMAPPSNNIFGPATPTKQPIKAREDTGNNIFGAPGEENESPSGDRRTAEEDETEKQVDDGPSPAQSAQAYAKRMQQGAGNPITGAVSDDKPAPIMRVRQPPGGNCSKLW